MIYIVADTHGNKIEFKANKNDILIHLGDWEQGEVKTDAFKVLVSGNHDIFPTDQWDFVCDGFMSNHIWFTHEPAERCPKGSWINVHGHTHYHNMNDIGFEKKWFHYSVPPNQIMKLDRFMFGQKELKKLEKRWE